MRVISEPQVEPISLALARLQCKIDAELVGSPPVLFHEDDVLLEQIYIPAAREWCENYTGLLIGQRTVEETFHAFPTGDFALGYGPIRAIQSLSYYDADYVQQQVDSSWFTLHNTHASYRLVLGTDFAWPTAYTAPDIVTARYLVGYSVDGESPDDRPLPKSLKAAMLLIIGHLHRNRSETVDKALECVPLGVRSFLNGNRVRTGFA